ncbi:hypothetical protein H0H93_011764 [Arthromyces matolae]|nr:hypothetical protein H0H93_011764 [Arthromyces matolae]
MSTRRVVIDDADSSIQYYGSGWFTAAGDDSLGIDGPTYLGSQHGFKANGNGGFTFTFVGTSVELYGTNGQVPYNDGYDPKWGCRVDGQAFSPPGGSSDAENNWPLCATDGLSEGTHQLVIDVTGVGDGTFWFDRLMYTPSGSTPSNAVMWVDATRDSAFQYDNTWHSASAMVTAVNGGSVTFGFTGTALTWVGEIPGSSDISPASLTYTIDGSNSVTVPMVGKPSEDAPTQKNHVYFTTANFASGSHTIKVTYDGDQKTPLTADYVYVRNGGSSSSSSTSASGASSVSGSSSSGQSSNSNQSPSSPVGASSSSSQIVSSPSVSGLASLTNSSSISSPSNSTSSSQSFNSTSSNSSSSHMSSILAGGETESPQQVTVTSGPLATSVSGTNNAAPSAATSHSTNPWIFVAAACAGIVLILLLLFFFVMRRRRRRQNNLLTTGNTDDTTPTPFPVRIPPTYNDPVTKIKADGSSFMAGDSATTDDSTESTMSVEHADEKRAIGRYTSLPQLRRSLEAPPSYTV